MGKKKFTTVRIKLTTSEIGWEKMQGSLSYVKMYSEFLKSVL